MEIVNGAGAIGIEEIINHIIEVDKKARESMEKTEDFKKNAESTIAERKAGIRADLTEQASRRVQMFEEFERKTAEEEFEKSHNNYENQMKSLNAAREQNFESWVNEIVSRTLAD